MNQSVVEAIRAHFPALQRQHGGQPVAYFDGPGGTQVPASVPAAITDYLLNHNANAHWAFTTSVETDAIVLAARHAFADFLNCSPQEVVFGANMTTLAFHVARAIGRGLQPGDELVVTDLDHHANRGPWQAIAKERGLVLRSVGLDTATGELDWEDFERQVTPRTRVVAVGAASNALGTVNDVKRAVGLAKAVGALTFVDAVAYAPHALVDVQDWGCDFLACSAYKFYGPHVGVLYGRHALLAALDVPKLDPAPDTAPDRLETGTANFEGIAGAAAAVDFLASLDGVVSSCDQRSNASPNLGADSPTRRARLANAFAGLHAASMGLFAELWDGLAAIPGLRLYGPGPHSERIPTLSFTLAGVPAEQLSRQLAALGLFASSGNFYAATVAQRYGQEAEGFLRIGLSCYSTHSEIVRLIEAVRSFSLSSPVSGIPT
jgi:cysteine desulfurase family protein (TIGR01976 family)